MDTEVVKPDKSKLKMALIIFCVSIPALLVFLLLFNGNDASIRKAVKEELSTYLYNPSQAKFSGRSETTIDYFGNDTKYADVEGWVESTNTFGAVIRVDYTAELTKENGVWVVDEYYIDDDLDIDLFKDLYD